MFHGGKIISIGLFSAELPWKRNKIFHLMSSLSICNPCLDKEDKDYDHNTDSNIRTWNINIAVVNDEIVAIFIHLYYIISCQHWFTQSLYWALFFSSKKASPSVDAQVMNFALKLTLIMKFMIEMIGSQGFCSQYQLQMLSVC